MKATQQLHDLGQSLWLDNITRDLPRQRHAEALHRRAVRHGAYLEPDDLRSGDQEAAPPTTPPFTRSCAGQVGRGALLRVGARRPHERGRPVPADLRAHLRRRRLGFARGVAPARLRHQDHAAAAKDLHARAARPNLYIKIPGHEGRAARHRGGDLRGRADQCDAALFARALSSRRRKRTCAASSGASPPAFGRMLPRSRRSSSAAGTSPSRERCPTR